MTTRKAFTPAELRDLANEPHDFHHPHLLDAMRGALLFCADVIDAANEAVRQPGAAASPASGREPLTDEQIAVLQFLYGMGNLDGCGFGDRPHGERGLYWWRKHLRAAFPGIAPAGGIGGE